MKPDSANPAVVDAPAADVAKRLRAGREAAALSVDDAADALHLDREIVAALEAGNFESLGAAVFVKGYVRAYARLLGLDEAQLVAQCVVSEPDPEQFRSVSRPREVKTGASLPMVMLGGVLTALLIAGALFIWSAGDDPDAERSVALAPDPAPSLAAASSEPLVIPPAAAVPPVTAPGSPLPAVDLPVPSERAAAEAGEAEPAAEPAAVSDAAPPVPATVRLELRFSDECWVEISDARRRLLYGLEKPGTVRVFEAARLPLRFYLGKTDAVAIKVADLTYNVPPEVRTGRNTARFVVSADDIRSSR